MLRAHSGACLLAGALFLAGCDINAAKDAFDEFDVIIELEPINTTVAAGIVDARTGNFISSPVTLRFVGDDAGSVIDMYSDPIDEQSVSGGLTSFGIANGVVPSEANPVTFRIVASAPGYQTGSTLVTLTEVGEFKTRIRLASTDPAQMPSGGGTAIGTVQTLGGTVQTGTTVETTPTSSGTTATVIIPTGTRATTSTGAAAQGQLSTTVTYYLANASTAVPLPTSSTAVVQRSAGTSSTVSLLTVASATIRVTDVSGTPVTNFSTPIQLRMGLDALTVNPATGQTFVAGDQIEVFQFEESQGLWVYLGMGTIVAGAGKSSSTLDISYRATATGWFAFAASPGTCSLTVNVNGNTTGGTVTGQIHSNYRTNNVVFGRVGPEAFAAEQSSIRVPNLPLVPSRVFLDFLTAGGTASLAVENPGGCWSTQSVTLPPPPPQTIDVLFSIRISSSQYSCPAGALRVTSSGLSVMVGWKAQGASDDTFEIVNEMPIWTTDAQDRITGGSIIVRGLVPGHTYTFFTMFGEHFETRDVTITGPNHVLDISKDVLDNELCAL